MGTFGHTSMPTYYVTTTYKLTKVSDGSEVASGNFKASDRGSEQNAIGFTLHKIADKVTEAIKKAGPVVEMTAAIGLKPSGAPRQAALLSAIEF